MEHRLEYASRPDVRFFSLTGAAGCVLLLAGAGLLISKMISHDGVANQDCMRALALFTSGATCGWVGQIQHAGTRQLDRIAFNTNAMPAIGVALVLVLLYWVSHGN